MRKIIMSGPDDAITQKQNYLFFFGMLLFLTFITIILAAIISADRIFPAPADELSTFNFSRYHNLSFDDTVRGTNYSANITLAVFSDFKCSACIEQYPELKKLHQDFPDVNLIFKHLNKEGDNESVFASMAYECTRVQKKNLQLADYLFTTQFTNTSLWDYMRSNLTLNFLELETCLNSSSVKTLIEADGFEARYLGVKGTPTMFLDGIEIEGVHPYEVLAELVRKEEAFFNGTKEIK